MYSEDDFVKKLDKEVQKIKGNEEWRREYMTLFMRDRENIEKGREEGREEGIHIMAAMLKKLRVDEKTIVQTLQEDFQLTDEEARKYLK